MSFFDKLKKKAEQTAQGLMEDVQDKVLSNSKEETIDIADIPTTLEDFKNMNTTNFKDANSIAALTVVALCVYLVSSNLSIEMLNYLKGPRPLSAYEIQFLRDRFRDSDYLALSFFEGATPENNYEPSMPLKIKVYTTPHSEDLIKEGYIQLFLQSGGADSKRGVKLRQKESTGEWFLWEYFLLPDIRKPDEKDPWA